MLFLAVTLFPQYNVSADWITDRIRSDMQNKKIGLYDTVYGVEVNEVKAGQQLYLAINATGFNSIYNKVTLYHGRYYNEDQLTRLIDIRIDPGQLENVYVPVPSDPLILKTINFPDSQMLDETGLVKIYLQYKPVSPPLNPYVDFYTYKYYYCIDDTIDQAYICSSSPNPSKTYNVYLGYLGDKRTNNEISAIYNEFLARFSFATKGYGALTINDLGRKSFPADNTMIAGKLHNYSTWWNSVSHNLAGTDLLPLDINDPEDFEMIKLAWYSEAANHSQLYDDIEQLFNLDSLNLEDTRVVIFTEAPYWAAGSQYYARSVYYNQYGFYEYANGQYQYGIHKDFGPNESNFEQEIALHEFGHLYGLAHPPVIYEPAMNYWEVKYNLQGFEKYSNIMHQGNLNDYPTDLFYKDSDIITMLQITPPALLKVPMIDPVGSPVLTNQINLTGKKQAYTGIKINGQQVVLDNSLTTWSYVYSLSPGVNRLDIAEYSHANNGHPLVLYLDRISDTIPSFPEITVTTNSNVYYLGQGVKIHLSAQAASGLLGIWGWVEKLVNGTYQPYIRDHDGWWTYVYGAVKRDADFYISFEEAGIYRIVARARDMLNQQSNIPTAEFTVNNWP